MDPEKYAMNLGSIIAHGYIANAICVGKDLGIFEALKKFDKPVTSEKLSDECSLKERYVQEWLGCMVAANIIEMEDDNKYFVPENCKDYLGAVNFAGGVPRMALMFEKAKQCFKKNGPNGYSFLDMEPELINWIDTREDGLDTIALHILKEVEKVKSLDEVHVVLDVGCGQGSLARAFTRVNSEMEIYAIDFNKKSIEKARELNEEDNENRCSFYVEDVGNLPASWSEKFDMIIAHDVLHDLPNPLSAIIELRRVLKSNGIACLVDPGLHSSHKENKGDVTCAGMGYAASCFVCLPNSMTTENAAALGIGWGMENKEEFLEKNGFVIKHKISLMKNDFKKAMFCMKQT